MLNGKVALVTGSTSGIGYGMATALAQAGATVVLNGLGDPTEIEASRDALAKKTGQAIHFEAADMSKPSEIRDMIDRVGQTFGRLDILVNNAGIQHTDPVDQFPSEKWDAVIAINQSSVFHASAQALPWMRKNGWGRIINTASVHGLVASVNKIAYVAAKHAVMGMTKVMALETAQENITVNAINPGWVRTELVEKQIVARAEAEGKTVADASKELLAEKQPSLEFVTVDALGQTAVFLCSDSASQITGIALPVDGGWTAV